MAQVAIREYDAKKMFSEYSKTSYEGFLIESESDFEVFEEKKRNTEKKWVIKPDQLFGKRGKYGLVGVNLDMIGIEKWWKEKNKTEKEIKEQIGTLHTFLIEPFVPHTREYYVAIKTERDHDMIYFSVEGGIEVEENWDKVQEFHIPLGNGMNISEQNFKEICKIEDEKIVSFIHSLYSFFVEYGFTYLEINPFTFDADGNVICLDMVARVDNTEAFKQKSHWGKLDFPHPFGPEKSEGEKYIEKLDSETGASLKFRVLNPHGKIWLLTSGGGASVIIADTLGDLGYAQEIGNYGECSGNPDRENTRAYTKTLLSAMLEDEQSKKYLIIAGAIANFTHIDKTFSGIIDALREYKEALLKQKVHILVRRGGINDIEGLLLMKNACKELGIPCEIADGSVYMTDILSYIKL